MIKYKVRTAFLALSTLDFCDKELGISEFKGLHQHLNENDYTSVNLLSNILRIVEMEKGVDCIYYMLSILSKSWSDFFIKDLRGCESKSQRAVDYYNLYLTKYANIDWSIRETRKNIYLENKCANLNYHSRCEEILLLYLSKSIMFSQIDDGCDINVSMPFSRRRYPQITDKFEGIQFDKRKSFITIQKTNEQIKNYDELTSGQVESKISCIEKIRAASYHINMEEINGKEISFQLGMSEKMLQRRLKEQGLDIKSVVKQIKSERAAHVLKGNSYNIKRTYHDCGYQGASGLIKLLNTKSVVVN